MFRRLTPGSRLRWLSAVLVLALVLGGLGCAVEPAAPARVALLLRLTSDQQLTGERVEVTVTGDGLPEPIRAAFAFVNDTARGSIEVPAGQLLTIRVDVFNAAEARVATGETTTVVGSGASVTVPLQIRLLVGTVPVTVIGTVIIVGVSPATASVRAGGEATIAAQVRDTAGQPLAVPLVWGVDRPPAALVTAGGVVQLLDTGVVRVTASAGNRAATTVLTGLPGTVLDVVQVGPDSNRTANSTARIDVTVRDPAGIDSLVVGTRDPSGNAGPTCRSITPIVGVPTAGTFRCVLVVPAAAAAGRWPIGPIRLHAGSFTTVLDTAALRHRGAARALRVTP